MFSNRTIAAIGAFSMIAATAMTGYAQPRHHSKDADTDTDPDQDADTDTAKPKTKARVKARAKTKNADTAADVDTDADTAKPKTRAKTRAKTKAKTRDTDTGSDADAEAEAEKEREKEEKEKERARERERAREKEAAEAEAEADAAKEKAREKATETESQATGGGGAGGGEAYHGGTLGFSIPITVVGAATGAAVGEPAPTVDIVYFLDDKAALDLIVGLNVHRKHAAAMGVDSDSNLISVAAGLGYRMYSSKNGLRSFLEPQAVISWPDISTTDALTVKLGGLMGLERNLTPWFSVSGAIGATLNFASTFKDIQLATSATLAANLYWR